MYETFGERLKIIRKTCKFTQQNIAEALGIDRTTYSCYERDITIPDAKMCCLMAKIFNISLYELLGEEKRPLIFSDNSYKPFPSDRENSYYKESSEMDTLKLTQLTKDERRLICMFRGISEEQQNSLIEEISKAIKSSSENEP